MSSLRTVESDYWYNRDGTIVHTSDCIHSGSKGSQPWNYAQGRPRYIVRGVVEDIPWLRLCSKCWEDSE